MSPNYIQERPLGQWKTLPANKLHNVTSRLISSTARNIHIYRIPIFYQYQHDLDFNDFSRSLKVKSISDIRLCLIVKCPNQAPLRDISIQNLGELGFDISISNVMVSL